VKASIPIIIETTPRISKLRHLNSKEEREEKTSPH
jgi:hypothetical protein